MSQVLRDGKEASCQIAVARISGHLSGQDDRDVDPDTRDYCRARAKLSEDALHELTTEIANEADRLVEPQHLWKGRHAKLVDGSTFMMADTPKNQPSRVSAEPCTEDWNWVSDRPLRRRSLTSDCLRRRLCDHQIQRQGDW